jgi:hypothetical protein
MIKLIFPFIEEKMRALKLGDEMLVPGVIYTGRVAAGLASGLYRR